MCAVGFCLRSLLFMLKTYRLFYPNVSIIIVSKPLAADRYRLLISLLAYNQARKRKFVIGQYSILPLIFVWQLTADPC